LHTDITGVILAGGKSKRMGTNKALLKINDTTIIERSSALLKILFSRVIIITNTPDEYSFLNLEMYGDIYLGRGPLAGIHSALFNSSTEKNFILSCDIPFISADVIKYISDYKTKHPVTVVYADGFIQQLAGIYSRSVLPEAENILKETAGKNQKCKVLSLLDKTGAEILKAENIPSYKKDMFLNMNTVHDYEEVVRIIDC
jgi:molybdenum cofactor guanylyltransferase